MREDWDFIPLKDACNLFTDGDWIESKNQSSKGIRLIQTGNIGSGKFKNRKKKARFINEATFNKLNCTEVIPGDLLVSRLPDPVGRSCVIPDINSKMITAVDCTIIRPKREILYKNFLLYYQMSPNYYSDVYNRVTGTTRSRISRKNLGKIVIPIPPLPEQKRIVSILDEAFAALDQAQVNIERNIENAEELFQSKLNEVFERRDGEWDRRKMGDICSVLNGYAFKSREAVEDSDTQLLRMGNLYQNKLDLNRRPVFYPNHYAEEYSNYLLEKEDLIMSLTGTVDKKDYGYTVEIPDLRHNLLLNQRIMKIIIKKPQVLNKQLLKNYLLSPFFLDKLYSTASGTRQANLSSRKIMNLPLYYPQDLGVQESLVNIFNLLRDKTGDLYTKYKAKSNTIEELKKSLLQKAFSGELTAKEEITA